MQGLPENQNIDTASYGGKYSAPETFGFGQDVLVRYVVGSHSIRMTLFDRPETFTVDEIVNSGSIDVVRFEKKDSNGELISALSLGVPRVDDVALSYTRFGNYRQSALSGEFAQFVFGVSTANADMPRTGSASYSISLQGTVVAPVEGGGSTGYYNFTGGGSTFTANFADMSVATTLLLTTIGGAPGASVSRDFGSLTGAGIIAANGPGFLGTFNDSGYVGAFTGAFFGPGAQEMGFQFNARQGDPIFLGGFAFGVQQPPP